LNADFKFFTDFFKYPAISVVAANVGITFELETVYKGDYKSLGLEML
jgi:hypothetical protein